MSDPAPTPPSGRVVLTTGANSGIGLATALELARRGFVSVGSVRSEAKAERLRAEAAEADLTVHTVEFDVTDADACAAAVDDVVARFGGLYGVVNNAGYSLTGAIEDCSDDQARHILETMVVAPMRLARLALPHLRRGDGGRIVNVSSIYGRTTTPLSGWYQASKHALEGVTDALRMEVAADGVQVVLIEPGGFRTGIWEEFDHDTEQGAAASRYGTAYTRARRTMELTSPLMGDPAACARVIARALSLRSPKPRYLVGADAHVLAAAFALTPTPLRDRITRAVMGL